MHGICLQSQLFGRVYDLCSGMRCGDIASTSGAAKIVAAVYMRDLLSVTNQIFKDFFDLLSAKRNENEPYHSYEQKYPEKVVKFYSQGKYPDINNAPLATMLFYGSTIVEAQIIPIL